MEIKRKKYILNSDKWSWWIDEEYTIKKSGKKAVRNVSGYYPTLEQLSNGFIERELGSIEAKNLKALKEQVQAIKDGLVDMSYKRAKEITKG